VTGHPPATPSPSPERTDRRRALLAAVVIVVLLTGFALGRLTGRSIPAPAAPAVPAASAGSQAQHVDPSGVAPHSHGGAAGPATTDVGGLAVSLAGLTLVTESATLQTGQARPWRFRVVNSARRAVTTFAVVHEKPMHLVVIRRDLTGYQHLHPTMAPDGTWSVDLRLGTAGSWRAFADFAVANPDGTQTAATLGADLSVAGDFAPTALPPPGVRATTGGYLVQYDGAPQVGVTQAVMFRVTRGGEPAALEPYLGAFGHLIVLRDGDLAYVHAHPEVGGPVGAIVKFWLAVPGPGRYRMFLDFKVAGQVSTAAFTITVS